jgi:hypothetical protein
MSVGASMMCSFPILSITFTEIVSFTGAKIEQNLQNERMGRIDVFVIIVFSHTFTKIMLLDISFQFGDSYPQGDSSGLLTNLIGALIGATVALFVFYSKTSLDKRKEREQKKQNEINQLKYFASMIEQIIKYGEKQSEGYANLSQKIKSDPLSISALELFVATNLNRLIKDADHEKIFHAYLNQFGSDVERIKKFQKIYSDLDFLYEVNELAKSAQEKLALFLIEKLTIYKKIAEEDIFNYCHVLLIKIEKEEINYQKDSFYISIKEIFVKYRSNPSIQQTVYSLQENFIIPLRDKIVDDFLKLDEGIKIAGKCREATQLYNATKLKSESTALVFQNFHDQYTETAKRIRVNTIDLKEKYNM